MNNMKRIRIHILMFLLVVCSSCSCNKERELPDDGNTGFVRYSSGVSIESKILGRNVNFSILLPSDYVAEGSKRYPVVYMLHGFGDNHTSWNDKWLRIEEKVYELEAKGLPPMIYIFPEGYTSYYSNKFNGNFSYMDMFIEELIPFVDKTYRTIADREHRATVGYSMGGFGAMVLPLKHPETFGISAPLSMSFRTDEQYMTESQDGWNQQWGSIFGGVGEKDEGRLTDYYKSHCPFYQFTVENLDKLSEVKWFFHCGDDEEQLLIANDDLHVQMRNNGFQYEYRVGDGGHTGSYWRTALNEVLPYIGMQMGGPVINLSHEVETVDIDLAPDGTFASAGYTNAEEKNGTAFYIAHPGLDEDLVKDIISILQRGVSAKQYMILPCNTSIKSLESWIEGYKHAYHVGKDVSKNQILAIGESGKEAYDLKDGFSRLYFDNADLLDDEILLQADPEKFWYMSQTDDGPYYEDMGGLYKACKKSGAEFQYRVRNGLPDDRNEILEGIETIKPYIIY